MFYRLDFNFGDRQIDRTYIFLYKTYYEHKYD